MIVINGKSSNDNKVHVTFGNYNITQDGKKGKEYLRL